MQININCLYYDFFHANLFYCKNLSLHLIIDHITSELWFIGQKQIFQDPKWHSEGDVYSHVLLAVTALILDDEFQQLSERMQRILLIAMLLHDVGKLTCTSENEKGIHHYGHSIVSMRFAQQFLLLTDLPLEDRVLICQLIKQHDSLIQWQKQKNIELLIAKMSILCQGFQNLYLISKADTLGRIAIDKDDCVLGLNTLKELSLKLGCYDRPYYLEDEARFQLGKNHVYSLSNTDYDVIYGNKQLVLLSGFPGSGKTSFIKQWYPNCSVIRLDDLREEFGIETADWKKEHDCYISKLAHENLIRLLRFDYDHTIVIDQTNLSKRTRKRLINIAYQYHARSHIIYLEPPLNQLVTQSENREKSVSRNIIWNMTQHFEYPNALEAHCVEYHS